MLYTFNGINARDKMMYSEKELEILKEAIKTYIIHNNYSYIVGLMETVKKELLIRYLDDLDEDTAKKLIYMIPIFKTIFIKTCR